MYVLIITTLFIYSFPTAKDHTVSPGERVKTVCPKLETKSRSRLVEKTKYYIKRWVQPITALLFTLVLLLTGMFVFANSNSVLGAILIVMGLFGMSRVKKIEQEAQKIEKPE